MKAISRLMLICVLVLVGTTTDTPAGSIWKKANKPRALYADDTAKAVGDNLSIIIEERSIIENETTRGMAKKTSRSAAVSTNIDLLDAINKLTGQLFSIPDMNLSTDSDTKFDGSADYDTDRKMIDQVTVTVTDVLPNGNLVVVGSKGLDVAGDVQTVEVSGVVRLSDINFSNEVDSSKVADFKIIFANKGRERRFTRPGWLGRILNILNPF